MNRPDARATVAAYVTGQAVSKEALQAACHTLASDAPYLRTLGRLCGEQEVVSNCDVCAEHTAPFGELSREQRSRELPEVLEHLSRCPACLHRYWEATPRWTTAQGTPHGEPVRRVLTEPIELWLGPNGRLRQKGIGPRAMVVAPSRPDRRSGRVILAWDLDDEEARCAIRLTALAQPGGWLVLGCAVRCAAAGSSAGAWLLEAFDSRRVEPAASGTIADLGRKGVHISPGAWCLRIRGATGDGGAGLTVWDILLVVAGRRSSFF